MAGECEADFRWPRAERIHLQRVLLASELDGARTARPQGGDAGGLEGVAAQAWYEYAACCLRRGPVHQGRAQQALERALKADPGHAASLAALTALLLHQASGHTGRGSTRQCKY